MKGSKLLSALCGLAVLAAATRAHAIAWYFQSPGSQLARDIDHLHQYVMWLIIVIFVGVFGFMFYACFAHRKSRGHPAEQFHENTTVELLWTVIPAIILVIIAWPVTKVVIAQEDTSSPDLTIKVAGYQRKSGYDHAKGEVGGREAATEPGAGRRPEKEVGAEGPDGARREGLRPDLRRLPRGAGAGHARHEGARARRQQVRHGGEERTDRHGAERPAEHGDAGVRQAALRYRDR